MSIFRMIGYIRIAILFAVPFVTELDFSDLADPDRKQAVVDRLSNKLDELNVTPPKWMDRYVEALLSVLVDVVVYLLKRVDFLERGSEKYQG